MADNPQAEAARRVVEENRKRSEESRKQSEERLSKGRPTPTQDENDRAKAGEHIMEHEDDGSGPDPHNRPFQESAGHERRQLERGPQGSRGSYETRQQTPARAPTPHSGSSS